MDKLISSSMARINFPEIINRVVYTKSRIIIKRHGKALVAVVSIDDLKKLEDWEDERDSRLLADAVESSKGTVPLSQVIEDYKQAHKVTLKARKHD
jgi:prevent-host-death family protein